jgi:hypothetical protein
MTSYLIRVKHVIYLFESVGCGTFDLPLVFEHGDTNTIEINDKKYTSKVRKTIDRSTNLTIQNMSHWLLLTFVDTRLIRVYLVEFRWHNHVFYDSSYRNHRCNPISFCTMNIRHSPISCCTMNHRCNPISSCTMNHRCNPISSCTMNIRHSPISCCTMNHHCNPISSCMMNIRHSPISCCMMNIRHSPISCCTMNIRHRFLACSF